MKVKVIMNFNDLEEKKPRKIGEEFECSEERANYLVEHKAVEIIETPKEEENVEELVEHTEELVEEEKPVKKKKNKK